MTLPPSTTPRDATTPHDSTTTEDKPSASRTLIVGAHAVLLGLAVVVAWATIGRDPGSAAQASVTTALSSDAGWPVENAADAMPPKVTDTPHTSATPTPSMRTTASFDQPATTTRPSDIAANTAASITPAAEASATYDPMIAIPQPGAAFPPTLPAAPADDPHYAFGGLYGTPGATRLVYLIDASGSLIDTFPFILNELQRALGELRTEQSFAVLFFSGNDVTEAPPIGMKRATTQAVNITSQWIDPGSGRLIASGPPKPDAAIRRALAYQPDAVILLSDGLTGGGDQALGKRVRLLSLIDTANTNDVVFHTLQVRKPDPLSTPTRLGTLELIALQSGGVHRYLGEDDLLPE